MIKLVVSDLAGTILKDQDEVARCFLDALADVGRPSNRATVNPLMGVRKSIAFRQLMPDVSAEEAEAAHQIFRQKILDYYKESPEIAELPGVSETIKKLQSLGVKVATDTGFDRETSDLIYDRLGWHSLMDSSVTSDEVENGRPAPDMILSLMDRFGITDPQEVAKVGDTPVDLQSGTAAGCAIVAGVLWGTHTREQLEPHPHTHILDTFNDLLPLIEKSNLPG